MPTIEGSPDLWEDQKSRNSNGVSYKLCLGSIGSQIRGSTVLLPRSPGVWDHLAERFGHGTSQGPYNLRDIPQLRRIGFSGTDGGYIPHPQISKDKPEWV